MQIKVINYLNNLLKYYLIKNKLLKFKINKTIII